MPALPPAPTAAGGGPRPFDLVETMAFDPMAGLLLLEHHLARMKASAAALGFRFNRHDTRNELQAATFRLRVARQVRLLLAPSGNVAIEIAPPAIAPARLSVAVVPLPAARDDDRLRHRTSDRTLQEGARRLAGTDAIVFEDADGFLAQGGDATPFVRRDGRLLTPPRARLLSPGVLHADLIERGEAIEADLTRADLAGGFLLGTAASGLVPAFVAVAKEPLPPL